MIDLAEKISLLWNVADLRPRIVTKMQAIAIHQAQIAEPRTLEYSIEQTLTLADLTVEGVGEVTEATL